MLLDEAVEPPTVGPRCRLSGGRWWSYYDQVWVTSASGLDIDHMVPLAESWDSGASAWTAEQREAYANDQRADASLVAVTARSNRSKSDGGPAGRRAHARVRRCQARVGSARSGTASSRR